ncbi:acyl-CoA oxidase [Acrasis kona]|uniref:Acyl-coenzyme A oxidase n=1 Tax=Acrasis kona TaxID=1008807 RepID=A0AAW2ZCQ9_9EUKA
MQQEYDINKVNPLLARERKGVSFDVSKMTNLLDGGIEKTKAKQRASEIVYADEVLRDRTVQYMRREENMAHEWKRVARAIQISRKHDLTPEEEHQLMYYVGSNSGFSSTHSSMFAPTLANQTNDEQRKKWLPLARDYKIMGTYAQTEIGHGSNVRGLETIATYDKESQEFIINSPTKTSIKWWPGGLGKLANHAVVYAQLVIAEKNYGVHGFIVQIRDLEKHKPLPGVTVGDIGPKLGFASVDNGYLKLDNVRIPRDQMLARYSSVDADGTYHKPIHAKIGYGTMMFVRTHIVYNASDYLARGVTIAIRYSAIRTQFPPKGQPQKTHLEIPVLDYQTQQYRLLPLLATAYAFHFVGDYMMGLYNKLQQGIKKNDLSLLPLAHAATAGLKAITTETTANGIEECRKCCGGHGYSHLSGLPELFASYVPNCTYEGENVLLLLQTAGFIIKKVQSNKFMPEVNHEQSAARLDVSDLDSITNSYARRAKLDALHTAQGLNKLTKDTNNDYNKAWENSTVNLVRMSRSFLMYVIVHQFSQAVKEIKEDDLKKVMDKLCRLYALYNMDKECGEFDGLNIHEVRSSLQQLLKELRSDAVGLVDAFNFPDFLLRSALGRFDGNAYDHMIDEAMKQGLNTKEGDEYMRNAFSEYVKPLQQLKSKL